MCHASRQFYKRWGDSKNVLYHLCLTWPKEVIGLTTSVQLLFMFLFCGFLIWLLSWWTFVDAIIVDTVHGLTITAALTKFWAARHLTLVIGKSIWHKIENMNFNHESIAINLSSIFSSSNLLCTAGQIQLCQMEIFNLCTFNNWIHLYNSKPFFPWQSETWTNVWNANGCNYICLLVFGLWSCYDNSHLLFTD